MPLDLARVWTSDQKQHWAFLLLGWGLIADVDLLSEPLRWMGEARFTVVSI